MRTFIAACCTQCFRSRCHALKISPAQASYVTRDEQLRGIDRGTEIHVCIDFEFKYPRASVEILQMMLERQMKEITYGYD